MKKVLIFLFVVVFYCNGYSLELNLKLDGYRLIYAENGEVAKENVYRLHGKPIPLKDAVYQSYTKKDNKIWLWISESVDGKEAKKLYDDMNSKIKNSKTFKNQRFFDVNGARVGKVDGMGMTNYYYSIKNYNIWIAMDENNFAKELIQKINANLK